MGALILLALSALIGFALGTSFSWLAIAAFSIGLAVLSSAILHIHGFGALAGIAIVVACLTVSQMVYLAGVFRRPRGLFQKQLTRNQASVANNELPANHTSTKSPHSGSPKRWAADRAPL